MPIFQLVVRDPQGRLQQRREAADSASAMQLRLSQSGLTVMLCREEPAPAWQRLLARRSHDNFNLLLFCRELQILLQAGMPLLEALLTLNEREGNAGYRSVLSPLLQRLQEGHTFSHALAEQPVFPKLFVAMIAASEHSGALDDALGRYIAYQEAWRNVRGKLISASIYPLILIAVGSLVCGFMLLYLAPKFSLVYQQSGTSENFSTALLVGWGRFVQTHHTLVMGVLAGVGVAIVAAWRHDTLRQRLWQAVLRIGPLQRLMHVVYCTHFYRSLALLLRGGNTALQALNLSRQVLPAHYQSDVDSATRQIQQGSPLSLAFAQHGLTTDIAQRMLHSGEHSGKLAHMLEQTALFHEHEIMERIERLTRVVEPLLMLLMGLLIGTLVIGMYMPIFDVAGQL